MQNKSLAPEQNERLRVLTRAIVDKEFAGNVSVASRKLKISHSLIFEFLDGRRGAGPKLVLALADHTGRSTDELLGRPVARGPVPQTALGARPDWPELRAETEKRYGHRLDPEVLDDVAHMSFGRMPERVAVDDIKRWHDLLVEIYARDPKAKEAARA